MSVTTRLARPAIIVSNQQNIVDSLFLVHYLWREDLGDFRAVAKKAIRGYPIIGGSTEASGDAFVERGGGKKDLDSIRAAARLAYQDGASFLIFPEGTRFRSDKVSGGYKTVLQPHFRGFEVLYEELKDYQIRDITLDWSKPSVSHFFQSGGLFGKKITLETIIWKDLDGMTSEQWINHVWRIKDQTIQSWRTQASE